MRVKRYQRISALDQTIYKGGELEDDVDHAIRARWLKWRSVSVALCDCSILIRLKKKVSKTIISGDCNLISSP